MGKWVAKSLVHRLLFYLPAGRRIANLLRRSSTRLDTPTFLDSVASAHRHRQAWGEAREPGPKTVLEVGTGWNPVQPIAHFLCGTERVDTWDIESLVSSASLARVIRFFLSPAHVDSWQSCLPSFQPDRVRHLQKSADGLLRLSPREALAHLNIHLHLGFPEPGGQSGGYDLSFSHSVLQYFPAVELRRLLRGLHDLAGPRGVTTHWISLSDQFARFDPSISPYNFLRFSDAAWRWLDSPLIPLSRLRSSEYLGAFADAGWVSHSCEKILGPPLDPARDRLAPRFQAMDPEDIRVVGLWWQGRRSSAGPAAPPIPGPGATP